MVNKHIRAIPSKELTSVDWDQEARILLLEYRKTVYELKLNDKFVSGDDWKRKIFDIGFLNLKNLW